MLAQCPQASAVGLGVTLTSEQQSILVVLQQYAIDLASFIQTADLTQTPLDFPMLELSLLDYPLMA